MLKKSLYLAGPDIPLPENHMKGFKDAVTWRAAAFHYCLKYGVQVINPIAEIKDTLNTNGRSFIAGDRTRKEVEAALALIDRCDYMLVNLYEADESSWIALIYAHNRGKQVIAWTPFPLSPWLGSYTRASFERLDDALEYVLAQSTDDHKNVIDWSIQYETGLKERSEKFPSDGETDFQYFSASSDKPIIMLAPHATSYWQLGQLFEAENYTGALAASLCRITGIQGLISSYSNIEDSFYNFQGAHSAKTLLQPQIGFLSKLVQMHRLRVGLLLRLKSWQESREIKLHIHADLSLRSDPLRAFCTYTETFAQARNLRLGCEFAEEENSLLRLSRFLGMPLIEIFIHKSSLIPQMQRAPYHNVLSLLEEAIDASEF
ncbi:MAG: hypothetical protein SFT81_05155 [Candidatus Caenarcaniphilales bacterium]|nr:hypothetical protein [Candidatus Caenarcaniphilales bacterium]